MTEHDAKALQIARADRRALVLAEAREDDAARAAAIRDSIDELDATIADIEAGR